MSTITPPKDYVRCELCGTWRPRKKTRLTSKVDPETKKQELVSVCSDDSSEGLPLSKFCARTRGVEGT